MDSWAVNWFANEFPEPFANFAQFEEKFRERFDCENSHHALMRRISNAEQKSGQLGSAFIDEVRRWNRELNPGFSDAELFDFIKAGLNDEYAACVVTCDDLDATVRAIRSYERRFGTSRKKPSLVAFNETPAVFSGDTPLTFPQGRLVRGDGRPANSTPRPSPPQQQAKDNQRFQNYQCFVCNEPGHLANECPNKKQRPPQTVPQNQADRGAQPNQTQNRAPPRDNYQLRNRPNIDYNERRQYRPRNVNEIFEANPDLRPHWQQNFESCNVPPENQPSAAVDHHCDTVREEEEEEDRCR